MKKAINLSMIVVILSTLFSFSDAKAITCTQNPVLIMVEWFCQSNLNPPTYNAWIWTEFPPQYTISTPETLTNANVICSWGYSGPIQPLVRATRADNGEFEWGSVVTLTCADDGNI